MSKLRQIIAINFVFYGVCTCVFVDCLVIVVVSTWSKCTTQNTQRTHYKFIDKKNWSSLVTVFIHKMVFQRARVFGCVSVLAIIHTRLPIVHSVMWMAKSCTHHAHWACMCIFICCNRFCATKVDGTRCLKVWCGGLALDSIIFHLWVINPFLLLLSSLRLVMNRKQ